MTDRAASYEAGMRISYDADSRRVRLTFRGRIIDLPARCTSEAEAIRAGEAYCWYHGWRPRPAPAARTSTSMMRSRQTRFGY